MRVKSVKRLISCVLITALCITAAGCGKKEIVIDDYGDNSLSEERKSERVDDLEIPLGTGETLEDIFGKTVAWSDEFAVDGKIIKANVTYDIPETDYLNVYEIRLSQDEKDKEEKIVKALFGDTAKKIETLKYKNKEEYMPLMYKYRDILATSYSEDSNGNVMPRGDVFDDEGQYLGEDKERYMIISSSFNKEYKWLDEDKFYIHMYEGVYNGMKYGLLLAYDGFTHSRYIFFNPININEQYPGGEYKTLIIRDKEEDDPEEYSQNSCKKSKTEVTQEASDFLAEKLGINQADNVITTDSLSYQNQFFSETLSPFYDMRHYNIVNDDDSEMSMLLYSDKDYITSFNKLIKYNSSGKMTDGLVDYQILAEQEDIYRQQMEEGKEYVGEFIYTMDIPEADQANFTPNGYAVYLGSEFNIDTQYSLWFYLNNYGTIKVNDSGVFGVDLKLINEIETVTTDVKLMDFDSLMKSVKKQLPERLNMDDVNSDLYVSELELTYCPYIKQGKQSWFDMNNFTVIPAWAFSMNSPDINGKSGRVVVNAMNGEILDAMIF